MWGFFGAGLKTALFLRGKCPKPLACQRVQGHVLGLGLRPLRDPKHRPVTDGPDVGETTYFDNKGDPRPLGFAPSNDEEGMRYDRALGGGPSPKNARCRPAHGVLRAPGRVSTSSIEGSSRSEAMPC